MFHTPVKDRTVPLESCAHLLLFSNLEIMQFINALIIRIYSVSNIKLVNAGHVHIIQNNMILTDKPVVIHLAVGLCVVVQVLYSDVISCPRLNCVS